MYLIQSTLDSILEDMTNINNNILTANSIEDINILYNKLKTYEVNLQEINHTIEIISSLKDNLKLIFRNHILKKSNKKKKLDNLDKLKIESDKSQYISYRNITNDEKFKDLDCIKFPVINISNKSIDSIVNTPIYFIIETNEYCLKINNNLIKGNIGNILSKNKEKTQTCKKKNCNGTFFNKSCKYLHQNEVKNFTDYSWKYINKNKMGKVHSSTKMINNYDIENTRHIGSLDSLNEDLVLTDLHEKNLRNSQLMHDILLYQILNKYLS